MIERIDEAARRAIAAARGAGATDVEVSWAQVTTEFVRFARSRFTQVGRTEQLTLRVRAIADGRLGTQVCASADPGAVERTARTTVGVARMSQPLDVPLAFATPATAGTAASGQDAPALPDGWTARAAPARLARAFERAAEVGCAGSLKAYRRTVGVLTAGGLERRFGHAHAELGVIADAGGASGFASQMGRVGVDAELDMSGVVDRARETARRARDPIDIEPAAYDVVLAPEAIAELIEWMAMASFGGNSLIDETSLLFSRRGEPLCDERIDVSDQTTPGEPPFDAEGIARTPVWFIRDGVAGDVVNDLVTAARLRDARGSTGHAPPVDGELLTAPTPSHVHLRAGTQTDQELVASVSRGLYVTRLHYVNGFLDTRRATMTGMTRDGTFLIEDGTLGRGIHNLRFTENMLDAFSRLGGIANEPRDVPTWWSNAGVITTPAVLIRGFHFTGKSR